MNKSPLVITGAGAITAHGSGRHVVFQALCAGTTKVRPLRGFDPQLFRSKLAYEIDDRAGRERPLRSGAWLRAVVEEALREHGADTANSRLAVFVGTGLEELRSLELWSQGEAELLPHELHHATSVRQIVGQEVPVYTIVNACAASLYALAMAADMLQLGEIDVAVVAGSDAITESMYGLLDRATQNRPEAVQPFDRQRRGVLMGEGAAAIVVTRAGTVPGRAALATLVSVGLSCDASHETAPDAAGILRAMKASYRDAAVSPAQVGVVYAHGTGTELNDAAEASALAALFGASDTPPSVTAIKSMTGHTSGSSGLVSLVSALCGLRLQLVPPTVGVSSPIDAMRGFDFVLDEARVVRHELVQINAFGFGGVNAVALLRGAA